MIISLKSLLELCKIVETYDFEEIDRLFMYFNISKTFLKKPSTRAAQANFLFKEIEKLAIDSDGPESKNIDLDLLSYIVENFHDKNPGWESGEIASIMENSGLNFENVFESKYKPLARALKADGISIYQRSIVQSKTKIDGAFTEKTVSRPDPFTEEQYGSLNSKLDLILEDLENKGLGQEIIFNEIDELRQHFDLGKKNWFQLLKGKAFDLTIKEALNRTVVKEIFNSLSEGYDEAVKVIGK